jgi:hypothetical protein
MKKLFSSKVNRVEGYHTKTINFNHFSFKFFMFSVIFIIEQILTDYQC